MNYKYFKPDLKDMVEKNYVEKILGNIRKKKTGLVVGAYRIFKDGEIVQNISENLVVAMGRQYVAQRIFGISHPNETEIPPFVEKPIWEWTVTHFGLGSGGALVAGGYVNLLGPEICDVDLYNPTPLSGNPGDMSYLTSPGDLSRNVNPTPYVVKPIKPSGTIDIVAADDINCSFGRTYSYVRIICSKFPAEPNYLENDDDYLNINEAALYYTDGSKKCRMFGHICFSPKYVEKKSELVIEWYILC